MYAACGQTACCLFLLYSLINRACLGHKKMEDSKLLHRTTCWARVEGRLNIYSIWAIRRHPTWPYLELAGGFTNGAAGGTSAPVLQWHSTALDWNSVSDNNCTWMAPFPSTIQNNKEGVFIPPIISWTASSPSSTTPEFFPLSWGRERSAVKCKANNVLFVCLIILLLSLIHVKSPWFFGS